MSERRRAILEAARTLFLAKGYGATSIAEIRAASGATTGSIYHAFGSKQGIALALLQDGLSAWQAAAEEAQQSSQIEDLIRSTVEGLIGWAVSDPAAFRLLDHLRSVGEEGHAGFEVLDLLERGRRASRKVLKEHADRGEIKIDDPALAQALILGPTYEYLRSLPHGCQWHIPRRHIDLLRDLAWTVVAPVGSAERQAAGTGDPMSAMGRGAIDYAQRSLQLGAATVRVGPDIDERPGGCSNIIETIEGGRQEEPLYSPQAG